MNLWHAEDWIPIIVNVRLNQAEATLQVWLAERGLTRADISDHDLSQEVSRLVGGGSGSTYYVRRSRLHELLTSGRLKRPMGRADEHATAPARKHSAVRIINRSLDSQGVPEGTIAWVVGVNADNGGGYRYELEVAAADGSIRIIRSVDDRDLEVLDSPIGPYE